MVYRSAAHLHEGVATHAAGGKAIVFQTGRRIDIHASTAAIDVAAIDQYTAAVVVNLVLGVAQFGANKAVSLDIHLSILIHVTVFSRTEHGASHMGIAVNGDSGGPYKGEIWPAGYTVAGAIDIAAAIDMLAVLICAY